MINKPSPLRRTLLKALGISGLFLAAKAASPFADQAMATMAAEAKMGVRIGNPYAFAMNDPWMRKPDEQRARIERLIGSKLNFNQSLPGQAGGKPLNPIAMNYDRRGDLEIDEAYGLWRKQLAVAMQADGAVPISSFDAVSDGQTAIAVMMSAPDMDDQKLSDIMQNFGTGAAGGAALALEYTNVNDSLAGAVLFGGGGTALFSECYEADFDYYRDVVFARQEPDGTWKSMRKYGDRAEIFTLQDRQGTPVKDPMDVYLGRRYNIKEPLYFARPAEGLKVGEAAGLLNLQSQPALQSGISRSLAARFGRPRPALG